MFFEDEREAAKVGGGARSAQSSVLMNLKEGCAQRKGHLARPEPTSTLKICKYQFFISGNISSLNFADSSGLHKKQRGTHNWLT